MSIVNYSEDKTLNIDYNIYDNENKKWSAKLDICPYPTCSCQDITFEFYDSENLSTTPPKHRLTIDVFDNKAVKQKGDNPTTKEDYQLAKDFVKKLTKSDWISLRKVFLDYKRHITNSASIEDLVVPFPDKRIEKDGLMVGYHDIFPYAEDVEITLDDIIYIVDDQYCLSYTCSCTHAGLTFIARKKETVLNKRDPLFIIYDYKTKTYRIENRGITKMMSSPKALVKEIQRKNFGEVFKKRHETLRSIYDNFRERKYGQEKQPRLRQQITIASNGTPKIRRNDPCPCGSGKKYKKCCMNKK
jgi:hypothetical protein